MKVKINVKIKIINALFVWIDVKNASDRGRSPLRGIGIRQPIRKGRCTVGAENFGFAEINKFSPYANAPTNR
jgi:hypothetical protein